jgi:putative transposase
VIKQLSKALIERCLEAELSTHLGYEKRERGTEEKTNLCNGFSRKTLKSEQGPVELAIPRDREGSYDPLLVKKYQTSLTGFNEKILWMYAHGFSSHEFLLRITPLTSLAQSESRQARDDVVRGSRLTIVSPGHQTPCCFA